MDKGRYKKLSLLVTFVFLLSTILGGFPVQTASGQPSDIQGHWAEEQISEWVDNGMAGGYPDGTFKPNNRITRAEFVTIVNRAFEKQNPKATADFKDVKSTDWFYAEVAAAGVAGYSAGYEDGTFRPQNPITRQEVASVMARLLKLDDGNVLASFDDVGSIADWAKNSVNAVVDSGIMGGYPDGTFKANNPITRAEAVVTLARAKGTPEPEQPSGYTYNQAGVYGPEADTEEISGDVVIDVPGVTLRNLNISGNLLLAEGIGDGDVTLKNVIVDGKTTIKGGGENSIYFEDCTIPEITVSKEGVRVVASGNTSVNVITLESGATLVEVSVSGPGFETVTVSEIVPAEVQITLSGDFEDVNVKAEDTKLAVTEGTVKNMTLNAGTTVTGEGIIETANINTDGSTIQQTPTNRNLAQGVSASISGQTVSATPTGGGGSSGGSSGSSNETVAVTGVSMDQKELTIEEGDTVQLNATVDPEDATNTIVTWSSDKTNVATVDEDGSVTGVSVGTAVITVTTADGGFKANCEVTVLAASPLTPVELEVIIYDEQEIWVSVWDDSDELLLDLAEENFTLTDVSGNEVEFRFNDPEIRDPDIPEHEYLLSPVEEAAFAGTYTLTFAKAGCKTDSKEFTISTVTEGPFTPGEGGNLPDFDSFTSKPNTIGGLYVYKSHQEKRIFSGTASYYPTLELKFPAPQHYNADSYTLQYSTNGDNWQNYKMYDEDVNTSQDSQDNFSLTSPGGDYQYRLLVNGGPKDGYVSNAVEAPLSYVNTYFSGWELDEGVNISGTMAPWVGRGLEASFTVENLTDYSVVDDVYLSHQWYRVNPVTYDMSPISGATSQTYITTEADAGHKLLFRATGDGENIGGFAQVISNEENVLPNKAFATDVTESGFTLNLYQSVDNLTGEDLILRNYNYEPVTITSVTPVGDSNAVFIIEANIPADNGPFYLENKSDFWRLMEDAGHGHMMTGLTIGSDNNPE